MPHPGSKQTVVVVLTTGERLTIGNGTVFSSITDQLGEVPPGWEKQLVKPGGQIIPPRLLDPVASTRRVLPVTIEGVTICWNLQEATALDGVVIMDDTAYARVNSPNRVVCADPDHNVVFQTQSGTLYRLSGGWLTSNKKGGTPTSVSKHNVVAVGSRFWFGSLAGSTSPVVAIEGLGSGGGEIVLDAGAPRLDPGLQGAHQTRMQEAIAAPAPRSLGDFGVS